MQRPTSLSLLGRCEALVKKFVAGKIADPLQAMPDAGSLRLGFDLLRAIILSHRADMGAACAARVWTNGDGRMGCVCVTSVRRAVRAADKQGRREEGLLATAPVRTRQTGTEGGAVWPCVPLPLTPRAAGVDELQAAVQAGEENAERLRELQAKFGVTRYGRQNGPGLA